MLKNAHPCKTYRNRIQLGDTARFPCYDAPYHPLDNPIYAYTWVVIAFGGHGRRHTALIERRHDQHQKWISQHQWQIFAAAAYGRLHPYSRFQLADFAV